MKPIIITLNSDNKVVMSVEEFKRHMDAAYGQGYSDGSCLTATTAMPYNNKWWYDVTCNGTTVNEVKVNAIESNATDCITGSCNCNSTQGTCSSSIKDYIKNRGE